jgi:hypothetical protein
MPINETLGPYKSQDLLSSYDIASALNQLTIAITALAGGGGGGGGGGLAPSGSDGDIQIRAAAALAAISRSGGVSTDYLARDNSYRSLPIVPVPAGADGDVQLKSGTSLTSISRFGGALTDYLAKDNSYKTIPATTAPAGTDGDLQVKSGTAFNALSRTGGATSDYLARDNAYHTLPAGFLPAGSDGDIQTKAGANLSALSRTGGVGTDYLARDNSYKTIPSGTQNQLTIASRTVAIGTTFVAAGSGGPSTIRTLAYATAADGGGATYTRVSSAPTYSSLIWFQSADGQYWSMLRTNEPFKLEQAGGGTFASGATNNAAVEAINSMFLGAYKFGSAYNFAGPNIKFGYGRYNFATPLFVRGASNISGMGSGGFGGFTSELKFPANCDGIVLGTAQTNGRLYSGSGAYVDYDARGSVIRDLTLTGGWDGSATTYSANRTTGQRGNGILTKAECNLENLYINRFAEMGVYLRGQIGGGGGSSEPAFGTGGNDDPSESYVCNEGSANNFTFTTVFVDVVGCDGFRDRGADSNAGSYISCSSTNNGAWGFNSLCFLGNYYFGCHSAANGFPWQARSQLDPNSGKIPGAYQNLDLNSASVYVGCYSESGQPGSYFNGPCTVWGGFHGAGSPNQPGSGWRIFKGYIDPFGVPCAGGSINFGERNLDGEIYNVATPYETIFVRAEFNRYDVGTFGTPSATAISLSGYGWTMGRASAIGGGKVLFNYGYFLGSPGLGNEGEMRFRGAHDGLPTSGQWGRGDHIDIINPSAGGVWGYVCTTSGDYSGTPPVWKSKGNLAA